jgi:hypothetical protein
VLDADALDLVVDVEPPPEIEKVLRARSTPRLSKGVR